MPISPKPFKFAILDDYQGIAPAHFKDLGSRIEISSLPDTLDPRDPSQHEELIRRLYPFDIILAMRERTPFSADTVAALPNLKLLLTTGTRNRSLDLEAFSKRGIPVAGTQGNPRSVSATVEHTWALILGLARHIARDDAIVKNDRSRWQGSLAISVSGKTLGLLGLGHLGSQVGKIAVLAFNMNVIAWSANLTQAKADERAHALGLPAGSFVAVPSKSELFERADIVSIHNVLSDRSRGIVGERELTAMKPTGLLINTSRGPLIDEAALFGVLIKGQIRGAALDVFDPEPLPPNSPWRTTAWGTDGRSEVLISPHMGYGEEEVLHDWYDRISANLKRWLDGQELQVKMN